MMTLSSRVSFMGLLSPPSLVLAANFARIVQKVRASWAHHDTLWYLAAGAILLFIVWVGHRRGWNEVFLLVSGMAGVGAICVAFGMMLFGDWARHTGPVDPRAVAREIRASHGASAGDVIVGDVCKTSWDCNRASACVMLTDDTYKRCQLKCGKHDACAEGTTCQTVSGVRVCLK